MPSVGRRGRYVQIREDESEEELPQHRRRALSENTEEDEDEDREDVDQSGEDSQDQVVKKLVRYALACEFQRLPITRTGIKEKGMQRQPFKAVFDSTQEVLRRSFGMELVELPVRENVTVKGRLKDANKKTKATKSSVYVLTSVLSPQYRTPTILQPSKVISQWEEATYIGFYTTIVSIIMLSPDGTISDSKFTSILKKLEADENLPTDKTALVVKKMLQQNYISKIVEKTADEEIIEWRVGPRGKVEIGTRSVQGLVREIYGENTPEDLERRLDRSLGLGKRKSAEEVEADEGVDALSSNNTSSRSTAKKPRSRRAVEGEEDDQED
ncbi:hypothetical protein ACMFMF_011715 [Clarireedia jacksonii]